ncbi:ankyrin repeat domain-containing protein [Acetobacter conturbans]|uniref:Ankyrin repeat domain-containing protein n=1 Tax=Acetobacter conturbans TaxID=1737472 RepID=A0ABX0K342_9PROT|nr:ankyrin repeat domain-containing protein [Acetobacter conturbans]NHN88655.1 ankyrin repeat domain-containing protein [Acetobacter conturbans]
MFCGCAALKRRYARPVFASLFSVGIAVAVLPIHYAHAQEAEQAEAEDAAKEAEARREAKRAAPPAALPGAQSSEDEAGHSNGDMEPTAALFEAINRGSLGAAKEAVNRGADLSGHNVISQTPLDMAIDLNRKDIMFFLLSMRTIDDSNGVATSTVANSGVSVENGSGRLSIGGKAARNKRVSSVLDRRYDASGGQPQPTVGFLGFGGS